MAKRSEILRRFGGDLDSPPGNNITSYDLNHCYITGKPFKDGDIVVGDSLGYVYLKIGVLNHLLKRKRRETSDDNRFSHIKSLNDVVEISKIPSNDTEGYLIPCGCLFQSLSILDSDVGECPNCKTPVDLHRDLVILKPNSKTNVERTTRLKAEKLHHNNTPIKRKVKNGKGIEKK